MPRAGFEPAISVTKRLRPTLDPAVTGIGYLKTYWRCVILLLMHCLFRTRINLACFFQLILSAPLKKPSLSQKAAAHTLENTHRKPTF
jgi:hypothetical protein